MTFAKQRQPQTLALRPFWVVEFCKFHVTSCALSINFKLIRRSILFVQFGQLIGDRTTVQVVSKFSFKVFLLNMREYLKLFRIWSVLC